MQIFNHNCFITRVYLKYKFFIKGCDKMEEVKLNNVDLNSLNSQNEQIKLDSKNSVKLKNNDKNLHGKNDKKNLFIKILFFQFLVSGFVFLILFSLKKVYPDKFKTISAQLNLAINEGPKFYDGLGSKIDEINKSLNFKQQNGKQLNFNKNNSGNFKHSLALGNEEAIPVSLNKSDVNYEKINIDDLENSSCDDGDVFFFDFVPPVGSGKVSSKFGERIDPITKKKGDFHNGVDIVASVGTPIYSISDGRVIKSGYSKRSGNFIIVLHQNGYESRYAHCSELLKKVGDKVKKGEKIALTGATGDVTGAHAHVGFKKDGKWLDPKVIFPNYG